MTSKSKNMKIMLLEDEPLVAMATEQILEDLGYENVDVFYRLDPATEAFAVTEYDTAILDVNVDQRRTSLALAREMRDSGVKIIFASGNSIEQAELVHIASHIIGKPYQESDVKAALEAI